jgi:hypothetical protein
LEEQMGPLCERYGITEEQVEEQVAGMIAATAAASVNEHC